MTRLLLCAGLFGGVLRAAAMSIVVDYQYDIANGNFFGTHAAAKAAVDAAAADLNAAILPSLAAVNTDVFTGTKGGTTATFDWSLNFKNPSTGASVTLQNFTPLGADRFTIYVGMRPLSGTTLGQGGSSGASVTLNGSSNQESQWPGAVANAVSASNMVMPRGGGPITGSISGSSTLGSTTANYSVNYGALAGTLWFDDDTDNMNGADTNAQLANYWQYDHTQPVAAGKNDFYSVALHEMLHSLGFGLSKTWVGLRNGTTWNGDEVRALTGGSGLNLISADGGHAADGLMSTRLSDGATQELVMDPTLTEGTRKTLTQLDLAFLRDLGYATVPEPSAPLLLFCGITLLGRRRR